MLKVVKHSELSLIKWSNFVENHPHGNIFQSPEMGEVYMRTKNYEPLIITVIDGNDDIMGVLLALILKEHSGILGIFSSRSIIWAGPLVKKNDLDILDFILKEYKKRIKRKAIYTQFRNIWKWSNDENVIFLNNGFNYIEHLDILVDLNKSEDVLLKEMHKGRRKNIGRAERVPLEFSEIENTDDFDKCLKLIEGTYKRVRLPCPERTFFYNANKVFKSKYCLKKFVLRYQDEIISCRFVLCYKGLVYDWFAGTDGNYLDKYPNDFLPWKILQWAKINGYNRFDFGGAGKPNVPFGIRDYKLKFGGELVEFGRFECIHNKNLFKIGHCGLKLFKFLK